MGTTDQSAWQPLPTTDLAAATDAELSEVLLHLHTGRVPTLIVAEVTTGGVYLNDLLCGSITV